MVSSIPLKIIIITHLGDEILLKCIQSIRNSIFSFSEALKLQSTEISTEIIVLVSNEKELPIPSNVQSHQFKENIGYARAVNFAFQNYGSQPLLILNDDVVLGEDCLEKLWKSYHPAQIIQPLIRFYPPQERIENAGHHIRLDGSNQAHSRGKTEPSSEDNSRLCFSGAAFLISPEIIQKVGLFDPDLSPFGEDLDYSLRTIRQGFSIRLIPAAAVYHKLGHSFGRFSLEKIISIEAYRIQARFRSFPLFLAPIAPISTLYRYWQERDHPLVPPNKKGQAILGTTIGIVKGYAGVPNALQKRKQDQQTLSDWEFFLLWWKQS